MENNEVMNNEEVMEVAEDVITATGSKKAFVPAIIGAVTIGGALLLYKKVIKPKFEERKKKEFAKVVRTQEPEFEEDDFDDETEDSDK